ncbi:MAG: substrate-binding domain-containing protein [Eubacteriales bacterium]|jgi:ribose transport system substrate-binding protein|nr:substrate-binding domain-containing protein [Eubacteriales bacterium]MDD4711513.1 substrate-binding domain-containing protein [Eubacteriales bacterium]
MKKLLALALTIMMFVGLFIGSAAAAETYDVIYLTPSTASAFWSQVEVGILQAKADLEKELGITVNYSVIGPAEEQETEKYITAFENAIAQQPHAIVTATLSIDSTVPKAREATEQGIVLNFVNCGLGVGDDGAYEETYNQFYFCSNDTIGELAGQAFLKAMGEKGMAMDKGVIGINMNVENEALNHRIQAFRDYIAANAPALQMTETYYNNNVVEKSQTNAENIISSYGADLIGMYSGNNITADGVANAVRGAGLKDNFVSVGVDSDDIEIQALRDGFLSAIIVQNAYDQGYKCMDNAVRTVVTGKNPEAVKQVNCPPVIVTLENVDSAEINFIMNPQLAAK